MKAKQPLYRKVNTRTHGLPNHPRRRASWERNTKAATQDQAACGSMHSGQRRGRDYTPLYRFLLSRVGERWDDVHSEAVSRLDRLDPIFHIVLRPGEDGDPIVRVGESTYVSRLKIDDEGRLALVDPALTVADLQPLCPCCTHTFNGKRFTRRYSQGQTPGLIVTRPGVE